ncbi:MAG: flavin reductase family protein [Chloroflexi bacterium]|nr:flavin reductase family protein [Chloroflexota bacterium]
MDKVTLGPQTLLYPMPVVMIGANVDGRPNFMTAAWCGIVNSDPPMISVGVRPSRYTFRGIQENRTFSINIPSVRFAREVDYCGTVSGAKADKVSVCRFSVFYGKLGSAPLIEEFPVNLECRVVHALDLGSHVLFVGRIEESHVSGDCLTDGKPDVGKIAPLIYVAGAAREYREVGGMVAAAYKAGLELRS